MPYQITITAEAESQLHALPVRSQRMIEAAILARLVEQPTTPTRAIKRLRPNPLAEFELRVGDLRVLYNVEGTEIILLVVGRKVGNALIVKARNFMAIKTIPLSRLEADPSGTLRECADSGEAFVIELPDLRWIAIQPLDPSENDELTSELLESNVAFRALVAKSKLSGRKPFVSSSGT